MTPRRGVTLVELLVVLAILAIVAALSAPALRARVTPPNDDAQSLLRARQRALALGRPVTIAIVSRDSVLQETAMPDGSVLAPPLAQVDRATGRTHAHP